MVGPQTARTQRRAAGGAAPTWQRAGIRRRLPTPRLGVSVSRVGTPPPLVGLAGTASLSGALKPTRYAYDANGNTIAIDGPGGPVTLTWDAENRLVGLDAPDGSESYTYDSTTSVPGKVTGLRRSKTTAAGTTHFVWDQQNLLAELDGEVERLVQYTGWPGFWGGLASARAGASSSFYGFDLSANTRAVFDALGAVDETALYSAFGPMLAGNLSGAMRFGGEAQYYSDARWLQVRARELEALTGRWLSRDPLGRLDADWPFGYVGNGPVGAVDGSGLGDNWLCDLPDWLNVVLGRVAGFVRDIGSLDPNDPRYTSYLAMWTEHLFGRPVQLPAWATKPGGAVALGLAIGCVTSLLLDIGKALACCTQQPSGCCKFCWDWKGCLGAAVMEVLGLLLGLAMGPVAVFAVSVFVSPLVGAAIAAAPGKPLCL